MPDDVVVVRAPARATLIELARLASPVLRAAGAERAVAFGSFARGTADGFSDLDLAVVLPTDLPQTERGSLLKELFEIMPVGLDLLVYTPDEFARGRERGLGVFEAIEREGVTVYERSKR
jgi:predicted nucleotidyltransferase